MISVKRIIAESKIEYAIKAACNRIAPSWPLDKFIAVNPYWGWVDRPFEGAGRQLAYLSGSTMVMPHEFYLSAWEAGAFRREHLERALSETGLQISPDAVLENLKHNRASTFTLQLLSDAVDGQRDLKHAPTWNNTITHQISQFCAAYFDRDQAEWKPNQTQEMFESWRTAIGHDHGISFMMRAPGIIKRAKLLPVDAGQCIAFALRRLVIDPDELTDFLTAVLLRINGWAAWCAYQGWQARLEGRKDTLIVDLLAIRLAWEILIDDDNRGESSCWARWNKTFHETKLGSLADTRNDTIAQRAMEIAFQDNIAKKLTRPSSVAANPAPRVQAAFCIDVRSEVYRRAWEAIDPHVQTKGFAGFFGLPIQYSPIGTKAIRPQLPGLLAPTLLVTETSSNVRDDAAIAKIRRVTLAPRQTWRSLQRLPSSSFTLVESLGIGYLCKLVKRSFSSTRVHVSLDHDGLPPRNALHPRLAHDGSADAVAKQVDLVQGILTAMNLTQDFARLVLLVGHGSSSSNNPHASGLDCGACCGQTGEINARVLAALLNDYDVRLGLVIRGLPLSDTTHFVAALHNTTTDEVQLFEDIQVPVTHAKDLADVRKVLADAGQRARAERAASLGLSKLRERPEALLRALKIRSNDWSQTRPEWGLANNAAFIIAPRTRTLGIDLSGRVFLHDYDWRADPEHAVLEMIMTAPMVVAHWINMQYFASTVDNLRYGSGNKVLHNVVGGRIGVFEGNGGDLRIGLPMQSVHNGQSWIHTPMRLSVYIEAPRRGIEQGIAKSELIRNLVLNRWLFLFRIDSDSNQVEAYSGAGWTS